MTSYMPKRSPGYIIIQTKIGKRFSFVWTWDRKVALPGRLEPYSPEDFQRLCKFYGWKIIHDCSPVPATPQTSLAAAVAQTRAAVEAAETRPQRSA